MAGKEPALTAAIEGSTGAYPPPAAGQGWASLPGRLWRAAAYARPDAEPIPSGRRVLHFLRCTVHLRTFHDWYSHPRHAGLREAITLRPTLVTRFLHPYLNAGWSARRKLTAISTHYALLRGDLRFLRFVSSTPITLARIEEEIEIRLDNPGRFEHEGELTLNLYRGDLRLFSLAFTLGTLDSRRVAYAGGLQGLSGPDSLETYRTMTHRMHGLRPRDLLIDAFRALCRALYVDRILGIGDRQRVCSNTYFPSSALVFSSYDCAWTENGAAAGEDGFFDLSPREARRSVKDTPSRKRSLYRRRYAMIDAMSDQIGSAVKQANGTRMAAGMRGPEPATARA
jgi:uncharacterized protein VirK/YbjX